MCSNTSSLTLAHSNSHNPSPSLGSDQHACLSPPVLSESASGHPAQMEDIFYNTMPVGVQSVWMGQITSDTFDYMVNVSFPAGTLLSDQIPLGMTAGCRSKSQWAGPSASIPEVPNPIPSGSQNILTHSLGDVACLTPPLNLIPPTPLKDAALHSENVFTKAPSNQ